MQGSNQSENEVKTKNQRLKEIEEKKDNTILVAEDDTLSRELILDQLKEAGFYSILLAVNGKEAVDLALKHSPDLILMDIRMPVMDGLMASRTIRQREAKERYTPIIGITAHAFPHEHNEFIKAGMDDSLTKPITEERLIATLLKFCDMPSSGNQPLQKL